MAIRKLSSTTHTVKTLAPNKGKGATQSKLAAVITRIALANLPNLTRSAKRPKSARVVHQMTLSEKVVLRQLPKPKVGKR